MAELVNNSDVAAPKRYLVIGGSPRSQGRSAQMATRLAQGLEEAHPGAVVDLVLVSKAKVHGCVGCDHCLDAGVCVFEDDMVRIMALIDAADELYVVSPVYFAGPPSQFKAVLDRFQPHYWKGTRDLPKRPAHLSIVREGGDPYGFEPLVTICRSALWVAGFDLVSVGDCLVGRDTGDGDGR